MLAAICGGTSDTDVWPDGVVSAATGGTAWKNDLNAQYAGGAGAGKYLFLGFNRDRGSTSAKCYTLILADDPPNAPGGRSRLRQRLQRSRILPLHS